MELINEPKFWPSEGDILFKSGNGRFEYASINRTTGLNNEHSQFLIIEGYREVVISLLEDLLSDEEVDWLKIDSKIFPILFVFRHYLEVILKDTLRCYNILYDRSKVNEVGFKKGHSLLELWHELSPFLKNNCDVYGEEEKMQCLTAQNVIEKIINELEVVDSSSFGFRYAFKTPKSINSKIEYSLPILNIELRNLQEVVLKVINFMEGINSEVASMLDKKQTMKGT